MALNLQRLRQLVGNSPLHHLRGKSFSTLQHRLTNPRKGNVEGPLPGGLPVELWLAIVAQIHQTHDLAALCATSIILYSVCIAALYGSINLRVGYHLTFSTQLQFNREQEVMFIRSLQVPRLSKLVTDLRIRVDCCENIHQHSGNPCTCKFGDQFLSDLLLNLANLQVLHFECFRCRFGIEKRHLFLERLSTGNLREVYIRCRCDPKPDIMLLRTLLAPFISSVKALRWDQEFSGSEVGISRISEVIKSQPLNVTRVMLKDNRLLAPFLQKRTITHLRYTGFGVEIPKILSQAASKLEYLSTVDMRGVVSAINRNPLAYRNIRHLGGFIFHMRSPDDILPFMVELKVLPNLSSLDYHMVWTSKFYNLNHPYNDPSGEGLVLDLGRHLPHLKRVYVLISWMRQNATTSMFHRIWELKDKWHGKMVYPYNDWDIMMERVS